MEAQVSSTLRYGCGPCGDYQSEEDVEIRKGPWTVEEDSILTEYVTVHGEGRWNTAARCAGLKRTGKSCRLRWLNYLRPDVRRGNISLKEQLLILQLHFLLGNRWSKIAQYLPGRTDNEIKNYWRTRVQKLAKHLKCDINSKQFRDAMHYIWLPRLIERINAASSASTTTTINISSSSSGSSSSQPTTTITSNYHALAVPNIPQPASGWGDPYFNPNPSLDSFHAQVSSNTSNGCYTDDMQNGSGPHPEFESWNSWYGQPANVGKVDTSELECFWISDESNWFSTITTNANM